MTESSTMPPGWYPDPSGVDGVRFWDGSSWGAQQVPSLDRPGAPVGPRFAHLARWIVVGLVASAVVLLVQVALDLWALALLADGVSRLKGSAYFGTANEGLDLCVFVVLVFTIVFWCVWQHQLATATRPALLRRSPAMHVASWFIPVVNLWFPFQNLVDLWRARLPGVSARLVGWWWGFWLGLTVVQAIAEQVGEDLESAGGQRLAAVLQAGCSLSGIVAAYLAVQVVRRLTAAELDDLTPGASPAG